MQIIPGQTGSDLLPPQIHLHQLWQGEAHIWRIFTGEMWVWVENHQMWRAFAWGFDAVGVTHSAAQTPDQREASAIRCYKWCPSAWASVSLLSATSTGCPVREREY